MLAVLPEKSQVDLSDKVSHANGQARGCAVWHRRALELARWAYRLLANRTNVCGWYMPNGTITAPAERKERKPGVIRSALGDHFKGRGIAGLHAINPTDNTSRWLAFDWDAHDKAGNPITEEQRAANWRMTLAKYEEAKEIGFSPLLEDSNGDGGYHLWLLSSSPVPTAGLFAFGQHLISDWESFGLAKAPEAVPAQESIPASGYGGWLRLPGKHPRRNHYSRFWDGGEWLESEDAVDLLLSHEGDDFNALIGDWLKIGSHKSRFHRSTERPESCHHDTLSDYDLRDALRHIPPDIDYEDWFRVGMGLKTALRNEGFSLWDSWSSHGRKYRAHEMHSKWESFTGQGVGAGTIFYLAEQYGWTGRRVHVHESPRVDFGQPLAELLAELHKGMGLPPDPEPESETDWLNLTVRQKTEKRFRSDIPSNVWTVMTSTIGGEALLEHIEAFSKPIYLGDMTTGRAYSRPDTSPSNPEWRKRERLNRVIQILIDAQSVARGKLAWEEMDITDWSKRERRRLDGADGFVFCMDDGSKVGVLTTKTAGLPVLDNLEEVCRKAWEFAQRVSVGTHHAFTPLGKWHGLPKPVSEHPIHADFACNSKPRLLETMESYGVKAVEVEGLHDNDLQMSNGVDVDGKPVWDPSLWTRKQAWAFIYGVGLPTPRCDLSAFPLNRSVKEPAQSDLKEDDFDEQVLQEWIHGPPLRSAG